MAALDCGGLFRPIAGRPAAYSTWVAFDEILFHMVMVPLPTALIAPIAAMNTRASIRPYSTAVAALVDRSSL